MRCFHVLIGWAFLCLTLSSCGMSKVTASKKLAKIDHFQPQVLAKFCADRFPFLSFDSTFQNYAFGDWFDYGTDTVYVDCDSVLPNSDKTNSVLTKIVKVPVTKIRVDTLRLNRLIKTENTARIKELELQGVQDKETIAGQKKALSISIWGNVIAAIILAILAVIAVIKSKVNNKLKSSYIGV